MGEMRLETLDAVTADAHAETNLNTLLARWHRATAYHAPLVDALVERFEDAVRARHAESFVRASDLGLGDDVTVLRMRAALPTLERQIVLASYGTIAISRYREPVETAATTFWPGAAERENKGVYVRLVDDVRDALRAMLHEPRAYTTRTAR